MGTVVNLNSVFEDSGLIKWRSFILSHQILLTFYLFQQRVHRILLSKKANENLLYERSLENEEESPEKATITQLSYTSVAFILRYTYENLVKIMQDMNSLKVRLYIHHKCNKYQKVFFFTRYRKKHFKIFHKNCKALFTTL